MRAGLVIFLFASAVGAGLAAQEPKTASSGIYTSDQAMRGAVTFENNCAECHLSDLSGRAGPPLKGDDFLEHWRGKTVGNLFDKIRMTMPADWRTQLSDTRAIDLVSFLLQKNGFPAGGVELTKDAAAGLPIK